MNRVKKILCLVVVLVLCICGCNNKEDNLPENRIKGMWFHYIVEENDVDSVESLAFYSDGTVEVSTRESEEPSDGSMTAYGSIYVGEYYVEGEEVFCSTDETGDFDINFEVLSISSDLLESLQDEYDDVAEINFNGQQSIIVKFGNVVIE